MEIKNPDQVKEYLEPTGDKRFWKVKSEYNGIPIAGIFAYKKTFFTFDTIDSITKNFCITKMLIPSGTEIHLGPYWTGNYSPIFSGFQCRAEKAIVLDNKCGQFGLFFSVFNSWNTISKYQQSKSVSASRPDRDPRYTIGKEVTPLGSPFKGTKWLQEQCSKSKNDCYGCDENHDLAPSEGIHFYLQPDKAIEHIM